MEINDNIDKHAEGSYYYKLVSQDLREKEERLCKYEEAYKESRNIVKLSNIYQKSILGFLDFLNTMKGKYHEATFPEKRNALDVLGVKVYTHSLPQMDTVPLEIEQEWLTVREASEVTGIGLRTLGGYVHSRKIEAEKTGTGPRVIHRDELKRFLRETPVRLMSERKNPEQRIEITYTPMFTGVQLSLDRSIIQRLFSPEDPPNERHFHLAKAMSDPVQYLLPGLSLFLQSQP